MAQRQPHIRALVACLLAAALLAVSIAFPATAHAATMAELQAEVVRCSDEYDTCVKHIEELQAEIEANEARIAELEAMLPQQRQRTSDSIRWQYRVSLDAPGLIEMVLSAENFYDMLATIQYLDIIQTRNNAELQALIDLDAELTETRQKLAEDLALAEAEKAAAQEALDEAIEAREALQAAILAQQEAERLERERALAEAQEHAGEEFTTASGNTATVEIPPNSDIGATGGTGGISDGDSGTVSTDPSVTTRDYFVQVWSGRIDNYLAGSPLAGYGYAFAEAAWDYGVDPRWSPAIAAVESSKGRYCFEPYNAWGWFAYLGSDWDSSIRAHVRGLANGYGYTLTWAAAARYCPPGSAWYSATATQMEYVWPNDQL